MGFFKSRCVTCKRTIQNNLDICPNCGQPRPTATSFFARGSKTECKGCKLTVSSKAERCPHCGRVRPSRPCFVATAVYGSEISPEVIILRQYRDDILLNSLFGQIFIALYYRFSPSFARWIQNKFFLKRTIKRGLDFLVNVIVKKTLKGRKEL
jgi:predicted amidophosphoribosyltransferase